MEIISAVRKAVHKPVLILQNFPFLENMKSLSLSYDAKTVEKKGMAQSCVQIFFIFRLMI